MKKQLFWIIILSVTFSLLHSCSNEPKLNIDVSEHTTPINLIRFDSLLFETDSTELENLIEAMRHSHPEFSSYYFNVFIKDQLNKDTSYLNSAKYFTGLPSARHFYDSVKNVFPDLSIQKKELEKAFAYYEYYFGDRNRPDIITLVSELGIGAFTIDSSVLGIGLDFFLGPEFSGYDAMVIPMYLRNTMTPKHVVPKSMHAWIQNLTHPDQGSKDVLDAIIHNGKLFYIKERLLPGYPKEFIFDVSKEQLEWLETNVAEMWSFALEKEMLYKNDLRNIERMTGIGPTTQGMPRQSPGGALNYLGYKIVEAYMNKNKKISMTDLVQNHNSNEIFQQSNFKPGL